MILRKGEPWRANSRDGRALFLHPYRKRHVADIDVPGRLDEPRLAPRAPRIDHRRERGAVGLQRLERDTLRRRNIGYEAHAGDGRPFRSGLVKAEWPGAAWHDREQLHPLHDAADERHVAIE